MWVELLGSKDEAARAIIKVQAAAEVECGHKLHVLRMDRGGEFTSATFYQHYAETGVQRHLTAPYTPQQNDADERRNQTVLGMARSMLKAKQVPIMFWGEAVLTAAFILNRSFTRSVDGMTPYEAWNGVKPDVRFMRVFGSVGHVKVARSHPKKLDDRSSPMVLIGYAKGSKAYKMYDPVTKSVHVSSDVIFDEDARWILEALGEAPASSPFTIEYPAYTTRTTSTQTDAAHAAKAGRTLSTPGPRQGTSSPAAMASPIVTPTPERSGEMREPSQAPSAVRFAAPPTTHSTLFNADDGTNAPHRFCYISDLLGEPGRRSRQRGPRCSMTRCCTLFQEKSLPLSPRLSGSTVGGVRCLMSCSPFVLYKFI
jgi:hypothetical protein